MYQLGAMLLFGAFGGFLSAIYLNDGKIIKPGTIDEEDGKSNYFLGLFADIILGAGAGLIASLAMGLEYPKYIYVSMLAGFAGGNFIAKQAKTLAEDKVKGVTDFPTISNPNIIEVSGQAHGTSHAEAVGVEVITHNKTADDSSTKPVESVILEVETDDETGGNPK